MLALDASVPSAGAGAGRLTPSFGVARTRSLPALDCIGRGNATPAWPRVVSLACWLLAWAAASAFVSGCSDTSRSQAVPSARVEPARAARGSERGGALPSVAPDRRAPETRATETQALASLKRAGGVAGGGVNSAGVESAGVEREPSLAPAPAHDAIATPAGEIEPGVNEEFDEDVLLDIDDALSTVDENAFATLIKKEQVYVNGELVRKEKAARPDNCRRWRALRRRGYAPKSALARQINAGALVRCGSLEFLARARSSRFSHVRNLLVGAGPRDVPAIVASAPSPLAEEARDRAVAKGWTLADFVPAARTMPSELPGRLSILEPAASSIAILNAEVWGDINSDGIEDLALSVLNTAADGSSFDMRLLHVTRLSASSPLTVLGVVE